MRFNFYAAILGLTLLARMGQLQGHEHEPMGDMPMGNIGAVSFPISCRPDLKDDFNQAVALLHSFWFNEAERMFTKVAAADPDCAMAYWGEAMTHFHLNLSWPTPSDVVAGTEALAKADAAREQDPREAAYILALHFLYDDYKPEDHYADTLLHAEAMAAVAAAYPKDVEAKIFYALALIASDPPEDLALVNPRKAVAILYPLFRQYPEHPGIAHYIIHACDNPHMAAEGLEAARHYASIAPAVPHALHMPGHIFARLGLWQDDIQSNLASKAVAENSGRMSVGAENRLHAMEFLEYAYLQTGQDQEARAIVEEAKLVKQSDLDPRFAGYYPIVEARFPALYSIETGNWEMAAQLQPIAGADLSSQELTLLAHAMAAGHQHDVEAATRAEQSIEAFAPQGSASVDEIHAWARFARDDVQGAVALLRPIAQRQDRIGKSEVELPAREMLAEMLLLGGNPREALHEYQLSLVSDPNRFNALLGAGRAAEQTGRRSLAIRFYRTLLSNCASANGSALTALSHARSIARQ